jgi:hypothetical protein
MGVALIDETSGDKLRVSVEIFPALTSALFRPKTLRLCAFA